MTDKMFAQAKWITSIGAGLRACFVAGAFIGAATGGAGAAKDLGPIAGSLSGSPLWPQFVSKFTTKSGAVIDNANGGISHSEGQGYGMILAVAAGDRKTFTKLWNFSRTKLQVRKDRLFAWRYRHGRVNPVSDLNNATDGDILIAWALLEADAAGFGKDYAKQAQAILNGVKKLIRHHPKYGELILPGSVGFIKGKNKDTYIINPSYWVQPAFERLSVLSPDPLWEKLRKSGAKVWQATLDNQQGLPPEWIKISKSENEFQRTRKMGYSFGYNAVRLPLYALWSAQPLDVVAHRIIKNSSSSAHNSLFKGFRSATMHQVSLSNGRRTGKFVDRGYGAIVSLGKCDASGERFPHHLKAKLDVNYYPAVLQMLSLTAAKMRYPQCV